MKTLIFSTLLLLSSIITFAQSNKSSKIYYCVQVCSTENPHLLKPEMVSIIPMDTAMVELAVVNNRMVSRILFVYETEDDQMTYHTSWLKQWHNAIMVTRTEEQVKNLFPLFTNISNEN
jgi:hypothetical protein